MPPEIPHVHRQTALQKAAVAVLSPATRGPRPHRHRMSRLPSPATPSPAGAPSPTALTRKSATALGPHPRPSGAQFPSQSRALSGEYQRIDGAQSLLGARLGFAWGSSVSAACPVDRGIWGPARPSAQIPPAGAPTTTAKKRQRCWKRLAHAHAAALTNQLRSDRAAPLPSPCRSRSHQPVPRHQQRTCACLDSP
jgi:hypothetical protein